MKLVFKSSALFIVVFIQKISVLCFNLEHRNPVVKRGQQDSYFGYSVALHKTENNSHNIRNSW